ncbi:hypothetical protein [Acinetobacter larvae]|uniref:Selenocysteine synthase n=1 Tax=Acinetobacter larvae TaxID=1789224 RepID=A0A1B2M359_9GAMM|nr:hypothetical protein [Acinetobacter larvae]AOA59571.1 hypothetical protein BFG52_15275 [Acinetobacter larvae]
MKNKSYTLSILASTICLGLFPLVSFAQSSTTEATQDASKSSTVQTILDYVPELIDATPTVLPPESNAPIVPRQQDTQDRTWADQKQSHVSMWLDRTANHMDQWFGEPDPDHPADATLRVIIDQSYDKHDQYEVKPRVRGKLKLPTLQRKLSLVFGDDSLDNELESNVAIHNENPAFQADKSFDRRRVREDNASIALRWSEFSKRLPFDLDADLGLRSGDDLYVRLKAKRDWQMANDFNFHAEQIYRYGSKSENYLRSNLELSYTPPQQALVSNQLSFTYADKQDDDLNWDNHLFRQHQFFDNNRFSYGMYTGGFYNNNDLRLNSWGPFVSWRQPIWREWIFLQGDLRYANEHREHRSHYLSSALRLEALF